MHCLTGDCDERTRPKWSVCSGFGIDAQDFDEFGYFGQVAKGVARILVVAAQHVHEKHVLPRTAAHGTRLNFAEVDIAKSEDAEGFEKASRNILHAEGERGLVGVTRDPGFATADVKEAGEVFLVVFNASFQNLASINFGGAMTGDSCGVG